MKTYVALLRGINVSGHKKVPMAELRDILFKVGFVNVQTYIQSGNVIFRSTEEDIQKLTQIIQKEIKNYFDFEVPVLIKTNDELLNIFNDCPFSQEKRESSYFTLLYWTPDQLLVDNLGELKYPNEEIIILNSCIYFYSSIGYGNRKYNNNFFERKLKVTATARNYKTMLKLLSLSSDLK
ncbi:MAG TPA: DUF1697 domain-containing protein [Yeosuana sp.]